MFNWLKRLAGIDPAKEEVDQSTIDGLFRHDMGPNDARYLRRLFPNSVFTKAFTKARRKTVQAILRRLRPEQRETVYALGWNKGVRV